MEKRGVITIDGPAGAGKSTVARLLARSLGYLYLDSGSLYRAVAWQAQHLGVDLEDRGSLAAFLQGFQPRVSADGGGFHLIIDTRKVEEELRQPWVSRAASAVAQLPEVRHWVKERLRDLARNGGVVTEGRDQGTVVFPEAQCKFYLTADLATRARRRLQDWRKDGDPPPLKEVMKELAARDRQDETRTEAPLRIPPGAVIIDTTALSINEVVTECLARVRESLDPAGRGK
ncbi:MAG: (d)CMP kinase [Deltaproteobacteria bacterium]|nr:(d)CMP kinase [Deltaproteobacteria bacterium]